MGRTGERRSRPPGRTGTRTSILLPPAGRRAAAGDHPPAPARAGDPAARRRRRPGGPRRLPGRHGGADRRRRRLLLVTVIEDLLTASAGMALTVRPVAESEVGRAPGDLAQPVAAVVRDGRLHSYDDPEVARLSRGDRVVCIEDVDHGRRGGLTGGPGGGAGGEPG